MSRDHYQDDTAAPPRHGRRAFLFGVAVAGAGLGAGLVADPEAADAASGASVLLGKANTASATTSVTTSTGNGLQGQTSQAKQHGVYGIDTSPSAGHGVYGTSTNNIGVRGSSTKGVGVYGSTTANNNYGVEGVDSSADGATGVFGTSGEGTGVLGYSFNGSGVVGTSEFGSGLQGTSTYESGVYGASTQGSGVYGTSAQGSGVYGVTTADTHYGVEGVDSSPEGGTGVYGTSTNGGGVRGYTSGSGQIGVFGSADGAGGTGVSGVAFGSSEGSTGVFGLSSKDPEGVGVYASNDVGYAIYAAGDAEVSGTLSKGGGSFKIDHPLDPAHKYLYHSFVESPDMMNVYNGTILLDSEGQAIVELPEWFEALNRDFRYQLTPIRAAAPDLHIATEVADGRFAIAGGRPSLKVSWQVTGIRQDAWANAHRIPVEADKPAKDQGRYLHPDLYEGGHGEPIRALLVERRHTQPARLAVRP